jgi:hypothetical protein
VKPWLWSDASDLEPVRLTRNLTITSANYSTQGYRLLEVCAVECMACT